MPTTTKSTPKSKHTTRPVAKKSATPSSPTRASAAPASAAAPHREHHDEAITVTAGGDEAGQIHTSAAIIQAPAAPPAEPEYGDNERVCLTYGYGLNDLNSQRFSVDEIWFSKDRVARNVPYHRAKALQQIHGKQIVKIHPNNASEVEIARRCGAQPGRPEKVARQLMASDLDAICAQFNAEELAFLAEKFGDQAIQRASAERATHGVRQ